MIDTVTWGANGWFMLVAGVLTYGTLALAVVALVKYLFSADRGRVAG